MANDYKEKFAKLYKLLEVDKNNKKIVNEGILELIAQLRKDILDIEDKTSYNVMLKFDQRIRRLEKMVEGLIQCLNK